MPTDEMASRSNVIKDAGLLSGIFRGDFKYIKALELIVLESTLHCYSITVRQHRYHVSVRAIKGFYL